MVSRWLRVSIAGLVLAFALGAGATVAVLAATSGGSDEESSPAPAQAPVEESEGRPWLGMVVSGFGAGGVIVQQVFADSPAHEAGVERGDIIKAIDGNDVRNTRDLLEGLEDKEPGDEVTLTLLRDDEEMTLQVTLGEQPEPLRPPEPEGPFGAKGLGEPPIAPPTGAIANAVADLLGVDVDRLPLTPERVRSLLDARRS